SRLCDHATGYDVLMPASNTESLPEGISAEPYGDVELPGFPGAIEVVRLTGTPLRGDRNDTGELWTRTPFV
ncbi:MAG: hypothetical protein VX437_05130, partial [Actinomycetota bacterium]|nr:hypothetical protein [Actinomycetota bacterium]